MIKAFNNYFLSGFRTATYFERRKASYLFYISMAALTFIGLVTVSQIVMHMGPIYLSANLIALAGVSASLAFFKLKKLTTAGNLMICSMLITIAIESIVVDWFNNDPSIRYRIYI